MGGVYIICYQPGYIPSLVLLPKDLKYSLMVIASLEK